MRDHIKETAYTHFVLPAEPMITLPIPCPSCPWRRDQDARNIPQFDLCKAESLAATCPDENDMGPDLGAKMFSCHSAAEGKEFPCAGWLAMVGDRHPTAVIAARFGLIDPAALAPREGWPALHSNYPEVLAKLRATCDDEGQ